MEMQFTGNPKPFGIIGLVIAIFSLIFSIVPCIGFYAVIPAALSVIFCLIAFLSLRQNKQNTGVPLSGLIIGFIALGIGIYQYVQYQSVFEAKNEFETELNKTMKEIVVDKLKEELEKDSSIKHAKDTLK